MKMKSIAIAAIGLAALSFSACSSENDLTSGVEVQKQTQQLTFSFAIPKGDPITYATHDQAEYDIASLWMYEFDAASGKLVKAGVNIKPQLTGNGPQYSYSKNVTTEEKGTRRFVFVANEEVTGLTVNVSTLADLQQKVASKTLAANASTSTILNDFSTNKRIPMTGEAKANGSNLIALTGTNKAISVEMTRVVARIDISNQVPNLQITDVTLANTNSQSFVFLNGNYTKPTTNTKVSGVKTFAQIPAAFGVGVELKKAFYLYEGVQPAKVSDAVQVQLKGKLSNQDVIYSIPFWKDNKAVTVKRNHIYKIVVKGEPGLDPAANTKLTFTIEDTPWNEITLNEEFDVIQPYIKSVNGVDAIAYNERTATVTLEKKAYSDMQIYADIKLKTVGALKAEVVGTVNWLTLTTTGDLPLVKVTANTTNKQRTAKIKLYDSTTPSIVRYLTIVQKG